MMTLLSLELVQVLPVSINQCVHFSHKLNLTDQKKKNRGSCYFPLKNQRRLTVTIVCVGANENTLTSPF